jgi:hypothetical protein
MASQINIATELDDKSFHFTRTSVYSFLQHNPWFNGTIYYLILSENSASSQNLTLIQKIYSKIELINADEIFGVIENPDFLKYLVLLQEEPIFYFKNSSLFTKDIKSVLESNFSLIDPNLNFLFKYDQLDSSMINIFERSDDMMQIIKLLENLNYQYFDPTFYINSNQILDKKFNQLFNLIVDHSIILFDFKSLPNTSKIHQVWLQKNKEALLYSDKPINVARIDKINSNLSGTITIKDKIKDLEPQQYADPITQKIIESINQSANGSVFEDFEALMKYLQNKSICLIANSSELLEYRYGELIDSHDVIIRFNGYKIIEENTGLRTDIHCVFRDYKISHQDYIDYKIVISKNINLWASAISKYHAKDAIARKYKLIDFSYPSENQLISARCENLKIPTSGICAFIFLNSIGVSKNVKLFGFNAYNGGDSSTILRNNEDTALASAHNYELEAKYLASNFTQVLPGVLKYKY